MSTGAASVKLVSVLIASFPILLKPSCYLWKITLKSNCKHVPADGVVRAHKNANVLLTGEVTGKNVTDTVKVFKKDQ